MAAEAELMRPLHDGEIVARAAVLDLRVGVRVERPAADVERVVHDQPDVARDVCIGVDSDVRCAKEARPGFVRVDVVAEQVE